MDQQNSNMKNIKFGNILDVEEGIIVHGCNSLGIMGSGIALQIKQKYPECFKEYQNFITNAARAQTDTLGMVVMYKVPDKNLIIANAITQKNFGRDGKKYCSYKAIYEAFETIVVSAHIRHEQIPIHYPLIGAGLGGGDWAIISNLIESAFENYPIQRTLWIYE